jgi:phosphoribosylaminoimidazole-succinocarboxamide synthase
MAPPLLESLIPGVPVRRGKVRDVYDFGDRLLLVATDRISAFDHVLPTGIPDKGRILTQLSAFWFGRLGVPHHLLGTDPRALPLPAGIDVGPLLGRSMVVRRSHVVPIECVARGYLSGSGWKEYRQSGQICGVLLPRGLRESDRLPEPVFTPTSKAASGHDQPLTFAEVQSAIGSDLAERLRAATLDLYGRGAAHADQQGILIADTKFEFGLCDGALLLIDEVLTPDSSRFWPKDAYQPGRGQASFDKQSVRDWLESSGWDKESPPPALPAEVVSQTRGKYIEAFERLTGSSFR